MYSLYSRIKLNWFIQVISHRAISIISTNIPPPSQTRKRHPRRRTHIEKLHQSDLNDKNKDCISLACRIRTPKPLALASPQSLPCLSQHLSYSAGVTMVSWPLSINEDNKMMLFVKFRFLQDLGWINLPWGVWAGRMYFRNSSEFSIKGEDNYMCPTALSLTRG